MPGEAEEASLAVPPSVLTLGVNRNIKSLLGGQETGNNQNTVSCPQPGRWASCHRPSLAAWGFPSHASAQAAAPPLASWAWVSTAAHAPRYSHETPAEAGSRARPTTGHHPAGMSPQAGPPAGPGIPGEGGAWGAWQW